VFDASFIATLPHTETDHPHYEKITPIYHMDTVAGVGFEPEEYVDIAETMETKKKMMGCHASQMEWLKNHDGIDILEFLGTVARFRGLQCGAQYAEAFTRAHTWPRNPTKRYLP
jgi:LmbE family N-acetylglucosaminyl deacetylase